MRRRSRARAALGQLVGDVLAAPLGALETRLSRSGWLPLQHGTSSASSGRLREVLDRDRALMAAQPVVAEPAPRAAPVPTPAPAAVLPPEEGAEQVTVEPIRTRTMARLLAAQGYRARASAIYRALLADAPDDIELQAELARLEA